MQLFNFVISAAIVSVVLFTSCKKNDDDNASPNPPAQSAGFYYGENGTTTLTKADSSWVNGAYNTIIAQSSGSTVVEINLTGITSQGYSLGTTNVLTYLKSGGSWVATTGTVTVTKNQDSKLSGTFSATAGGGVSGVTSFTGNFTDIPIK